MGALALGLSRPTLASILLALPLAVIGEAVRIWASGHIEKTRALATGGPYAHTRNPLYLGSLLLGLGFGVASASPWVVGAVAVYVAAFYPAVIREEAGFLREKFAAYAEWERAVPAFLPRPRPGGPRASRFARGMTVVSPDGLTGGASPRCPFQSQRHTMGPRAPARCVGHASTPAS